MAGFLFFNEPIAAMGQIPQKTNQPNGANPLEDMRVLGDNARADPVKGTRALSDPSRTNPVKDTRDPDAPNETDPGKSVQDLGDDARADPVKGTQSQRQQQAKTCERGI